MDNIEFTNSIEEIIKENKIIHGYKVDNEILPINDEIVDFMYDLSQEEFESYEMADTTKAVVVSDVKSFFDSQVILRDVLCVEEIDVLKLHGQIVQSLSMLITLYNQLGRRTHPFDIPLSYEYDDNYSAKTELHVPTCDKEEFLKQMNIYFKGIILSRKITPIVGISYTHELTHTQLVGNRGIIKDFYNMELLPIFMELLYAYKADPSFKLFKTLLARRINYLLYSFDEIFNYYEGSKHTKMDAMLDSKYVTSFLKALKLFNKYIYGSNELKSEIMGWIQQVFDGLMCLEDMLNHFEISYENSISLGMILSMKKVY